LQCRSFLECIEDDFLTQLIEELMRTVILLTLDLILTNKYGDGKGGAALAAAAMK